MDREPAPGHSDTSPPYDSSICKDRKDTPKHDQTQGSETKTDLSQVNRMVSGGIRSTEVPKSMLSATLPLPISYPEELAYPKALIRKGNFIYPAQDLSFPLYYLPEARYMSNEKAPGPVALMCKRHGTIYERNSLYPALHATRESRIPFATFFTIVTQGWGYDWSLRDLADGILNIRLSVDSLWGSFGYALVLSEIVSEPVVIKRNVHSGNTSEKEWLETHSWVDSTTNEILAWELRTSPGATRSVSNPGTSSSEENRLEFVKQTLGKRLRDILTAAWCISLWVDAEAARRDEAELKENKGVFGRLAKKWDTGESSARSSKSERNNLREQLGLGQGSISEEPRELMWYETRDKS